MEAVGRLGPINDVVEPVFTGVVLAYLAGIEIAQGLVALPVELLAADDKDGLLVALRVIDVALRLSVADDITLFFRR
jgi:hypothetical protein